MRKYMSKRQRPCDFCRSRKSACRIEGQPPCRLCTLHGRECTFIEAAQPRRKPNETLAAADDAELYLQSPGANDGSPRSPNNQHHLDGSNTGGLMAIDDQVTSPPAQLAPPGPVFPDMAMDFLYDPSMDGSEYQFMFRTPRSPASNVSLLGQPLNIPVQSMSPTRSQQSGMSSNDTFPDIMGSTNAEIVGLSSDMDPYLLQKYQTDDQGIFKFKQLAIHSVQPSPVPVQFLVARSSMFSQSREETGHTLIKEDELRLELEQIVDPEMGSRLVTLYERFIAPQYPIFSSQALPDPASSPPHLLAAIYSIAFPFYMYDDKLCIDLAYDGLPYPALSRLINRALGAELHSPSVAGVQALLLVVARPSSDYLVSDASYRWSLLGLLVSSAVNLGLHLDPSSWKIAPWQVAQRRRLSFTIYTLDRWLSTSIGRPPHIDHDNWLVASVEPPDKLDSGLSPEQWNQLLDFSTLTSILNKILSRFFSMRAISDLMNEPHTAVNAVADFLNELSTAGLGAELYQRHSGSPEDSFTGTVAQLGYHHLKLTLLRAALRPFIPAGPLNTAHTSTLDCSDLRLSLRATILGCQKDFSDYIKGMKSEDIVGLWPPWCPTAFSSLCFSLLLTITSSNSYDEAKNPIKLLHSTRRELRLKATSFPVLRLGLLRIDSIFWRGIDKVLKLEPHVDQAFRDFQRP